MIRLTENDLKHRILDSIYNIVKNTKLFEYLSHRDEFIDDVFALHRQIIENWCLIHYCTLTKRTETKEHWKDELYAHIDNIVFDGIKSNNSPKSRLKAIVQAFDRADLYKDETVIYNKIQRKFKKEGIKLDDVFNIVVTDCFNSISDIANVLASVKNETEIEKYIETI